MNNKIIPWLVVCLLDFHIATALGLRPAKTTIQYEETPTYAGQFWIVNTDHQELDLYLSVRGVLENNIILQQKELHLSRNDDSQAVYYEVQLPEDLPPGETTADIVVEQSLSPTEANFITSKLVLQHKIIALGPYPEKYVTAKVNFYESGDTIRLVSEVQNLGTGNIGNIQTQFYINDKEQQQQVLETESTTLSSQESKMLEASLDRNLLELGEFEVLAATTYDDQKVEVVKKLVVGEPQVDITYFTDFFIAHEVNEYALDLLNKWNTPLKNVYVDVDVKKDNQKVDQFRTKSVDLEAAAAERINDYLDGRNKDSGTYTFEMAVNFWNNYRMASKTFTSEFLPRDKAKKAEAPPVGAAVVRQQESSSLSVIIITAISTLILLALAYVGYRYAHRDEYE